MPCLPHGHASRSSLMGRLWRQSTQGEGYFSYRPDHATSGGDGRSDDEVFASPLISPNQPSTAFDKIKSFIGFSRPEHDEETGLGRKRQPRSRSHSERASTSSHDSDRRSASPSSSEESWGYGNQDDGYSDLDREEGYSSSMADDTSLPPQSRPQSPHLPLIPNPSDGIFGDPASRGQDLAEPKEFTNLALPSRQNILLPDEDLSIRFIGYRTDPVRNALWWAGCILTFGALGLFGHWVPSIWVKFCGKETAFEDAREGSWLVVEVRAAQEAHYIADESPQTPYGDLHIVQMQIIPYPYPLSTVFPQILPASVTSRTPSIRGPTGITNGSPIQPPVHALNGESPGGVGAAKDLTQDVELGKTTWEETTGFLKVMEYRYTRFALEPGTGKWAMIR